MKQQAAVTTTTIKASDNAMKKDPQPTIIKTPISIQNQNKTMMSNQTVNMNFSHRTLFKNEIIWLFYLPFEGPPTVLPILIFHGFLFLIIFYSQTNAPPSTHQLFVIECEHHIGTNFTACFEHKSNGPHACGATKSYNNPTCEQFNWWRWCQRCWRGHFSRSIRIDIGAIAIDCYINDGHRWYHIVITNQSNFSQQGNNCWWHHYCHWHTEYRNIEYNAIIDKP